MNGKREITLSLRSLGSIGMLRCTRYTVVVRFRASLSISESFGMKKLGSAMWTPISKRPFSESISLHEIASSKSFECFGSIVKMSSSRRSCLFLIVDSGTVQS